MEVETPVLSESERSTLRTLAYGGGEGFPLDWLAIYRLKQRGLVEDGHSGPRITAEGRRTIVSNAIKPKRE